MNAIILITGSRSTYPFAMAVLSKGMKIILFDNDSNAYCRKICDKFYNISAFDKNKIYPIIKELESEYTFTGIICYSSLSGALRTTSYLSGKMKTKGFSEQSVIITYDKKILSKYFTNVDTPARYEASKIKTGQQCVRYPCIIKQKDGIGSKGTIFIKSRTDLLPFINNNGINSFIIEDFIDGDLLHLDGYVQDNKPVFFNAVKKDVTFVNDIPLTKGYTPYLGFLDDKKNDKFINNVINIAVEIGINNHFFGVDFIRNSENDKYMLLEIGYLLDCKMDRLLYHSGVDVYDMLVDIITGCEVIIEKQVRTRKDKHLELLYAEREGQIHIDSKHNDFDLNIEWEVSGEDIVKIPDSISDLLGWYICNTNTIIDSKKYFKITPTV
jgi:carbamoylphosphate synthase large subunit